MSTQPLSSPASLQGRKKITTLSLLTKKQQGEPITMLTGYDYPTALALDQAGVDVILVGDSLAMVVLGYENTLSVTMEDMLHHCKAVRRGAQYALLVGDMPFMSYQVSISEAVRNAGRFLKEAGMDAVKLEGGRERLETIRAIVAAGIPVMGHLGLTPQSVNQLGGFRPQGRDAAAAIRLLEDAIWLQQAGCFSIVLESIPAKLAAFVSQSLDIPTIGIGAGAGCDGQVLVTHDMLGLFERFTPRFVKQYVLLQEKMKEAFIAYIQDVKNAAFPTKEHSIEMSDEEWQVFLSQSNHCFVQEGIHFEKHHNRR
ncbi:MAG: 3-methyl-2-oxobutanoate hydroxymethyltransferase [Chloroflexi bacterium]|nr:3-methyl-2-oxobutanoate hydroxymethyltransferase [Chloroflexota bacterium]